MSLGCSVSDIVPAIEVLYFVGKALSDLDGAEEKYRETSLFLESLAATLERVRGSDCSVSIRDHVDALKAPVEKFCENLKRCFETTLGKKSSPKDWQGQLRKLQKRARYTLFEELNVQELKNRISTPLQLIQVTLGLQCFLLLSAFQSNLSVLQPAIVSDIERLIDSSLIQYRCETEKSQESTRVREVLQWVHPRGGRPMIDVYEDLRTSLLDGSCEWVFNTPQFRRWRSDPEPSFLWITGIPGAGKTRLATRVIQRLESSQILAYYFCDTNDTARCEFLNIVQTWIWQLLCQDNSKIDKVASVRDLGAPPSEVTMKDCLDHVVACSNKQKRVVILDGLDECPPDVRRKLCSRLVHLANRAKVLLFSRRLEDISDDIRAQIAAAEFEHYHISSSDTEQDLTNFLETSVKEKLRLPNQDLELQIINSLRAAADGMFQWAALMIEDLAQPGKIFVEDYLKVLQDLPRGIDTLYGRILDGLCKSRHYERSQKLLQWIVCSRRPLTLEEVGEVLTLRKDYSRGNKTLLRDRRQTVRQLCGPLVEVKDIERGLSVVTLIHASAKDFLLDQTRRGTSFGALLVDSGQTHAQIAQTCLATLCDDKAGFMPLDFRGSEMVYYTGAVGGEDSALWRKTNLIQTSRRSVLQQRVDHYLHTFSLMEYAAMNWWTHFTSAKESALTDSYARRLYISPRNTIRWLQLCLCTRRPQARSRSSPGVEDIWQIAALRKSLTEDRAAFEDWLAHLQGPPHGRFTRWNCFLDCEDVFGFLPPVHIAAYFDFEDFVEDHLSNGGDVNIRTFCGLSPLCLAARGDSVRSVELLLQAGAQVNFKGNSATPLNLAIDFSLGVNFYSSIGCDRPGPYNVVPLLLHAGAEAFCTEKDIRIADTSILYKACRLSFPNDPFTLQLVDMLLAHGAKGNLNSCTMFDHDVPLQCAVQRDSPKLADLLLRNGADCEWRCSINTVNHPCKGHKTALLFACSKEHPNMEVIRILLDAGASVKAKCRDGRTALHMAAAHPPELAELLLAFGAEVNVVCADGSLPIHDAVREHNIFVLEALVAHQSELDAKDGTGLSPLAIALEEGLDDAADVLIHAGAKPESNETAARPMCVNTLSHEPELDFYCPRDENDQFRAFRLLRRPGMGVELPADVVHRILDLAEYWVKSIAVCSEAKQVDRYTAIPTGTFLRSARVAGRRENPVQKVRFVIRSHDQGWSSYPENQGTYDNSWTWFDIQIVKRSGRFVEFGHESQLLTKNVHARLESIEYDIVYGNRPRYRKCDWIDWLKPGDQLGITAMACHPEWVNYIEFAQIEVFTTYLTERDQ